MKIHSCLICIGSNTNKTENIKTARKELEELFPDIMFGKEMLTTPLYFKSNPEMFINQLGVFHSGMSVEEIKFHFRSIEVQSGRLPSDKDKEIVKLDIDLLMYDKEILKSKDMLREYIKTGLKEIL